MGTISQDFLGYQIKRPYSRWDDINNDGKTEMTFDLVKAKIDAGIPLIVGLYYAPKDISHIFVITGYSTQGGNFVITNDPFTSGAWWQDGVSQFSPSTQNTFGYHQKQNYDTFADIWGNYLDIQTLPPSTQTDNAAFSAQSIYPTLAMGSNFEITFDLTNTGTTTWTPGSYWLQNTNSTALGASAQQPITSNVAPGQTYRWTINMTAPATTGVYRTQWAPSHNGTIFGLVGVSMYIDVTVTTLCGTVTEIPQSECNALTSLYNSTNGANWTNKTGWLQTNTPCSWYGITCVNGHVTEVRLNKNNLVGTLPSMLGSLSSLTRLSLHTNKLTGSIPPELGNLSNLTLLALSINQLTGKIPPQLGNLSQLVYLLLGTDQLSGDIPPELGNLSQLNVLALDTNQLTGSIPSQLGSLLQLKELWLSGNLLTGSIPSSLGNLSHLTYLNASYNQLSGNVPWQLGNLSALQYLNFYRNQLTGSIPNSLGSLSQLVELHLGENQLSGGIPPELGNLPNLVHLALFNNKLTGSIPHELGKLTNVTNFDLSLNQLTGSIPSEIGNLSKLNYLMLGRNQLSGNIPTWIGNLPNLNQVWLDNNLLTGRMPSEIGNLVQLTDLVLINNRLTGEIPVSIIKLTKLKNLTISCGMMSSNSAVISFLNVLIPTWKTSRCLPQLPLPSIAAQDGWLLESTETSNIGGAMNATDPILMLGDNAAKKQYRSILSFNTSSLPDTAVITGAVLKVKKQAAIGGGDPLAIFQGFMIDIKTGFFASAATLQLSDFQAVASKTIGPGNPTLASGFYTLNLTTGKDAINKLASNAGLTQIRLRFKLDDNNDAVANYLSLYSGDAVNVADRPQLVVTYYVP